MRRVALLNIGAEPSKGTDLLREAHQLLSDSDLDFVGNIEGGDIFKGVAEVVVTDGFTGNVVLKLLEDFSGFMMKLVMDELQAHGATWGPEALGNVRKKILEQLRLLRSPGAIAAMVKALSSKVAAVA